MLIVNATEITLKPLFTLGHTWITKRAKTPLVWMKSYGH